ncbi:hypothetical protein HZH68_013618 [Vespula germanica]|uniref:Uncharacterized protein n=1 Tax=Vespula germanica TaxID=30212 RepID=A0A834JF02_VESGE|nr:hypothetical protein HZH68_013618 [Vespula germanica]
MIENNSNTNMEVTGNNISKRDDYESEGFNHGLRNNFGKNQNGTKGDLTFEVIKPARTVKDLSFVKIMILAHALSNSNMTQYV